jgi:hypothetical protein
MGNPERNHHAPPAESERTFAKKPEATVVAYKKETQKWLFNRGAAGTVRRPID